MELTSNEIEMLLELIHQQREFNYDFLQQDPPKDDALGIMNDNLTLCSIRRKLVDQSFHCTS